MSSKVQGKSLRDNCNKYLRGSRFPMQLLSEHTLKNNLRYLVLVTIFPSYSRTSMARTLMARLARLFRTGF